MSSFSQAKCEKVTRVSSVCLVASVRVFLVVSFLALLRCSVSTYDLLP